MWINFKNQLIFRDNILQYIMNLTPDFVIVPIFLFAMHGTIFMFTKNLLVLVYN